MGAIDSGDHLHGQIPGEHLAIGTQRAHPQGQIPQGLLVIAAQPVELGGGALEAHLRVLDALFDEADIIGQLYLISGVFFGFDWPLRYLNYVAANLPPQDYLSTSLWRGVAELGLPTFPLFIVGSAAVAAILYLAWKVGLNQWVLAVALACCRQN